MSFDEKDSSPMIEIGLYFRDKTKGDKVNVVERIKGFVYDQDGNKHAIEDCVVYRWTKEEIKEAKRNAENLRNRLFDINKD